MRQRLIRCLLFITSAMLVSLSAPVATGLAAPACDVTVAAGGDIQAALDA